jgi:hypothetical protein
VGEVTIAIGNDAIEIKKDKKYRLKKEQGKYSFS